ncbi:hypothetical protein [Nonomuraea sp. NPDC023979]|uniref:hypothetical protein n=1 Tax=Nonomuraea sp. NPDC023979 TaxID=3154796 RepID=UPI0033C167A4
MTIGPAHQYGPLPGHDGIEAGTLRGPIGEHAVIQRICARLMPPGTRIEVAPGPLGGSWVSVVVPPRMSAWPVHQRIARQLALVGWHAQVTSTQVVILGWSAPALQHRARLMQTALTRRLTDIRLTARTAVDLTLALAADPGAARMEPWGRHASRGRGPVEADHAGAIAERVCRHLCTVLRWPHRLADLDGFERTSLLHEHQLLIAQVSGLEDKLRRACRDHLIVSRLLALATWEHLGEGLLPARAGQQALAQARPLLRASELAAGTGWPAPNSHQGRSAGLTERHVGACVPNQSSTAPLDGCC